ncbi:DUF3592 domain-containing protein [Nocardiopsis potens]|uniref:DUF3592 domain-containing protein n=1 Tax=Nocardiopsis potens TaxID=1246458 RepID=UPI0003468477|nr:DUF3592 domain-containing protein [Nocardiopsis potens]
MVLSAYTDPPDPVGALVLGLFGLMFFCAGAGVLFREFRLDLIGARVPGRVAGMQGGTMSGGDGYRMSTRAAVVEYRTLDGDVIVKAHFYRYGGRLRPSQSPGDTVEVLYLPRNPAVFRIADEPLAAWMGPLFFCMGLSLLVFSAALAGALPASASPATACAGALLLAAGIALIRFRSARRGEGGSRAVTVMGLCVLLFVLPGLLMLGGGVAG